MADLSCDFVGIKSPNPFWLASAPPTDKEYNVRRAFEAGWGGVVWKTLGEDGPPVVNVNGPRYGAIWGADRRLLGLNNIELITDRPLEVNLREIKTVKRDYPDRALVVSLMVPCEEEAWKRILARVEETGADGVELPIFVAIILNKDQIPELDIEAAAAIHHTGVLAIRFITFIVMNFRTGATRTRFTHFPKIVFFPKSDDSRSREARNFFPQDFGFVVIAIDGGIQPAGVQPPYFRN